LKSFEPGGNFVAGFLFFNPQIYVLRAWPGKNRAAEAKAARMCWEGCLMRSVPTTQIVLHSVVVEKRYANGHPCDTLCGKRNPL